MVSPSSMIVSVKALLISTGVICIAIGMKVSVPLILEYFPLFWSTLISWLKPPYLYVVINGIIITIVVSSKFYQKHDDEIHSYLSAPLKSRPVDLPSNFVPVNTAQTEYTDVDSPAVSFVSEPVQVDYGDVVSPAVNFASELAQLDYGVVVSPAEMAVDFSLDPEERDYGVVDQPVVYEREVQIADVKAVMVNGSVVAAVEDEDVFEISKSTFTAPQTTNPPPPTTSYLFPPKPLVSSRFSHRKPAKSSVEGGSGRALRVAKPRRHETLENTWKMITDGRHVPLTRHLRKSDTWETHGDSNPVDCNSQQMVNKSETFQDRTTAANLSAGIAKLRKEPSLSQDELNRRVEAFINKFNEEMRLQREESLNRYKEMINRGAH